jgi:hypothetical protein
MASAQAVITCPDTDPAALESFCKVLTDFFTAQAANFPTPPGPDCGVDGDFGNLTQCRGFKFYYKETNASPPDNNALSNLKFDFAYCIDAAGQRYLDLKSAGQGQDFPIGPLTTAAGCACATLENCLVGIQLPSTNNFIFGYGVPTNAQSMSYNLCYPAGAQAITFQVYRTRITAGNSLEFVSDTPLANVPVASPSCTSGCFNIPTLAPDEQLTFFFLTTGASGTPGQIKVNFKPNATAC